jgi:hypothetical protein
MSSRPAEAGEVRDFGEQDHRRKRVEAAEAPQPSDGLAIELRGGERLDLFVELRLPRQRLLERKQARLERALQRRLVELLAPDPAPVRLTPVLPGHVHPAVAREEFQDAVPPGEDVPSDVIATPDEVAPRLLGLVGYVDRREFARTKEADELGRVAAVRLDALSRPARRQRRRDDLARDTERGEPAIEVSGARVRRGGRLIGG